MPGKNQKQGKGYHPIDRSLMDHWIWVDAEKLKRWMTMVLTANYTDNNIDIGNSNYKVKRGQSAKSLRTWADLFGCSTKAVTNFFKHLVSDGMISIKILGHGKHRRTLITIEDYDDFKTYGKRNGNTEKAGFDEKRKQTKTPALVD
jgi:hypothetical protein